VSSASSLHARRVVVIGSGFGGLSTALRLQAVGCAVTVLEQRPRPGGRAYQLELGPYTFDMGPSIVTAPALLDDLWQATGASLADYVDLLPLDPYYRIYFADGSHFDYSGTPARAEAEIARLSPRDVDGYRRLMADTAVLYHEAFERLGHEPFLRLSDMLQVVPALARHRAIQPVYRYVARYLRDPRLRQAYSFHPLFLGGNPFRASALYAIIPYLERQGGVWFVRGGMYRLVEAMARRFAELGGELVTGTEVDVIEVVGGRAVRVQATDGRRWGADAVVSNADVATTYARLVAPRWRRRLDDARLARWRYTMSCFLLYFGLDRTYPRLLHHTIAMGPRYRGLLRDIFDRKVLAPDFSLYLHAPTRTDPSLAPPGHESLYLLAPVPNLAADVDWRQQAGPYRDRIVAYLEQHLGLSGFRAAIRAESCFTPLDFRDQLSAWLGNAFSLEPTLSQSAYFRPHNRSEDVRGLYLAGAGTHPGAGLPGTLLSGEITSRLVLEDLGVAGAGSDVPRVTAAAR
jgi:phytoene desaturase